MPGRGPIGEEVDFVIEMLWRGDAPEVSSFYMFSEEPFALAMGKTLIKLVDLIMEKAKFPENEVTMARGFLKVSKYQYELATVGGTLDSRKLIRGYG